MFSSLFLISLIVFRGAPANRVSEDFFNRRVKPNGSSSDSLLSLSEIIGTSIGISNICFKSDENNRKKIKMNIASKRGVRFGFPGRILWPLYTKN